MTLLDLLPRLDEVAPKPYTDLPATLVWLAVEEGHRSPSWDDLRERLCSLRDIELADAEAVIVAALRAEDVRPQLDTESLRWNVVATADAIRAVLLRYALVRLDLADTDLDAPWLYRKDDRWLVLAMVPDLDAIARGTQRPMEKWQYRYLIEHPPIRKEK